jgi:hypothetical protein
MRAALVLFALGFTWAAGGFVHLLTSTNHRALLAGAGGPPAPAVGQMGVPLASGDGVWIVALLALVTILHAVPLGVALTHPPDQRVAGGTIGLLALAFSVASGFSVGLTYLPPALLVLAGAALSPGRGFLRPDVDPDAGPGLGSSRRS